MKKFALLASIILIVFLGFKFVKTSEASDLADCASISGYRLTQGETCKTAVNAPVVFSFHAKDADNNNLAWSINYGDGKIGGLSFSCPSFQSNNTLSVSHTWSKSGIYNVRLGVSNCKGGEAHVSFNVTVNLPVISASLEAVPASLSYGGGPATIFVHTAGATSCYIPATSDMNSYIEPPYYKTAPILQEYISFKNNTDTTGLNISAGDGAFIKVSPTTIATYNISCTGPGGTVNNSVKIAIDANAPPTAQMSISPSVIPVGGMAILTWSSTNSNYCEASDGNAYSTSLWKGKKNTSGTLKIDNFNSIDGSGTFSIKCFNSGGKSALAFAGWTADSSLPANDAFGLKGVFKSGYNPSVYLTWNPVLSLGYKGGYKIWRSDLGLAGVVRTDSAGVSESDTTSFYDTKNINCPSTHIYKIIPFKYDSSWNIIDDSNNASGPFTLVIKYPCN